MFLSTPFSLFSEGNKFIDDTLNFRGPQRHTEGRYGCKHTERQIHSNTERKKQRKRHRERDTHTETERQKDFETMIQGERKTKRMKDRDTWRQGLSETQRQICIEKER